MAVCLAPQMPMFSKMTTTQLGSPGSLLQFLDVKQPIKKTRELEAEQKEIYRDFFQGKEIVLVLTSQISAKEKRKLKDKITNSGGKVGYIVTKRSDIVACDHEDIRQHKLALALQYGVPIVNLHYINDCAREGKLLPYDDFLVIKKIKSNAFDGGKVKLFRSKQFGTKKQMKSFAVPAVPFTSTSLDGFELIKAVQLNSLKCLKPLQKSTSVHFYIIELHCREKRYCVFTHEGFLTNGNLEQASGTSADMLCRYVNTVDEATSLYSQLFEQMTSFPHQMKQCDAFLHREIGSPEFRYMQIENSQHLSSLEPEVSRLVETLWNEAVGLISAFLDIKWKAIRPWMVNEAEGILLQILSVFGMCSNDLLLKLSTEFYNVLPHLPGYEHPLLEKRAVVQKLDLCQVLKDMFTISEATGWASGSDLDAKYRALHCHIQFIPEDSTEFKNISEDIGNIQMQPSDITVRRVFEIRRSIEHATFPLHITNREMLFHCTSPSNVAGILSHGLLPPRLAVTKRGVERTDAGMLGSGIYFTDSIRHALKYSKCGYSGTRFLLVAMVALGKVHEVYEVDPSLERPPEGYDSIKGVKSTQEQPSDFSGNEFVIYNSNQQYLCYLVEFNLSEDKVSPSADVSDEIIMRALGNPEKNFTGTYDYELMETEQKREEPQVSGLQVVSPTVPIDHSLALEAVHVRVQIIDTVAKVILFQVYRNPSKSTLEAKFVFPLESGAAVCGFEAFIGGKHIAGEVKEKITAHKEYKQAISEGHGAYLLDEDKQDLFTVRVGNIPAETTALIKISYIAELSVEGDAIRFSLPTSIAPCQLGVQTDANKSESLGAFSVQVSLEMASEIVSINSPSHQLKIKKTDTKAVVEMEAGENWGKVFLMYVRLKDVHVPRMWVEKNQERDSEACMLTFYPEFEVQETESTEIILMLDASNSMIGSSFQDAIRICFLLLNSLKSLASKIVKFNIVAFGSFFKELFPVSKNFTTDTMKKAEVFLRGVTPNMGNTNLRRVLRTYNLLTGDQSNIFVISDGHIDDDGVRAMSFLSGKEFNVRVFTLATGQTANMHLLRLISSRTGGAFEYCSPSEVGTWEEKVARHVQRAQQPALNNVKVSWEQYGNESDVLQTPQHITSLFSGDCLVVYGFISNCTVATLRATINNQEFSTVVSTSELAKTKGILIHSLTARGIVRDWEDGPLDEDSAVHWLKKRKTRDLVIDLAKEHSLVTSVTSFLAVEKRDQHEVIDKNPPVREQLAAASVDILPYMAFYEGTSTTMECDTLPRMDILREERSLKQQDTRSYRKLERKVKQITFGSTSTGLVQTQLAPKVQKVRDRERSEIGRPQKRMAAFAAPSQAAFGFSTESHPGVFPALGFSAEAHPGVFHIADSSSPPQAISAFEGFGGAFAAQASKQLPQSQPHGDMILTSRSRQKQMPKPLPEIFPHGATVETLTAPPPPPPCFSFVPQYAPMPPQNIKPQEVEEPTDDFAQLAVCMAAPNKIGFSSGLPLLRFSSLPSQTVMMDQVENAFSDSPGGFNVDDGADNFIVVGKKHKRRKSQKQRGAVLEDKEPPQMERELSRSYEEIFDPVSDDDSCEEEVERERSVQEETTDTAAVLFMKDILSWKGGGLPICSAILARATLLEKEKSPFPQYLSHLPQLFVQSPTRLPDWQIKTITDVLKQHGLDSFGQIIAKQVLWMVLKLAEFFSFLLFDALPRVLEEVNGFDVVIERLSEVILDDTISWLDAVREASKINGKYPLLYSTMELGKSWEDFIVKELIRD